MIHQLDGSALRSHANNANIERIDQALVASTMDSSLLRLKGTVLGEISAVSSIFDDLVGESFDNLNTWLKSTRELAAGCTGGIWTLARTLTADTNILLQRSVSAQNFEAFETLCNLLGQENYIFSENALPPEHLGRRALEYLRNVRNSSSTRRVFRTSNHFLGMYYPIPCNLPGYHLILSLDEQLTLARSCAEVNTTRRYCGYTRWWLLSCHFATRWRLLHVSWDLLC